jgi:hypothetical protein
MLAYGRLGIKDRTRQPVIE